jgi:hypothetical protein
LSLLLRSVGIVAKRLMERSLDVLSAVLDITQKAPMDATLIQFKTV